MKGKYTMTYEKTVENVEKAIARLSERDVPLDEAVEIYKKALSDLAECRKELESAKLVISGGDIQ